ncbi:hypothetical protein SEA_TWISTER6_83 [Gordonia phage Twister6]|nr:hypothetical protein BI083_gp83 [Gordonia phage Twister6]YP_010096782.1 hypothetical protein KNT96_gp82 [Gordonia phage KimmyK]YP_010102334.1 hypothetical protein KNU56_gp83 [Gordonia phage Arri]QZD98831.1 hypothetical protein SEA_PINKCOFFEE_84 [Gordonia phage PinkCoffee]WAA20301.1 hypothetical protein SEA_TOGO_83 [Gordonia phage Togo]AOE44992.1 hypothetical protein SEA_TWISTER6_83 [Gordonia phage Twister6]AXH46020.1 hypothetical protein SEA_KIMMYK_82 [Gordonia phage KimmyK]QDB74860.1 hyp
MTANKVRTSDLGIDNIGDYIAIGGVADGRRTLLVGLLEAVSHGPTENSGVATFLDVRLNGVSDVFRGIYRHDELWIGDDLIEVNRAVLDDLESRNAARS